MPFNEEFSKPLKCSMLADLINCVEKPNGSSISAASFLKEFAEGVDFMHLDIAGTSEAKVRGFSRPLPAMLNTLFEFVKENFNGKK
jgi:leucyl aminopeptidase